MQNELNIQNQRSDNGPAPSLYIKDEVIMDSIPDNTVADVIDHSSVEISEGNTLPKYDIFNFEPEMDEWTLNSYPDCNQPVKSEPVSDGNKDQNIFVDVKIEMPEKRECIKEDEIDSVSPSDELLRGPVDVDIHRQISSAELSSHVVTRTPPGTVSQSHAYSSLTEAVGVTPPNPTPLPIQFLTSNSKDEPYYAEHSISQVMCSNQRFLVCSAIGCDMTSFEASMFAFPKNKFAARLWLEKCGRSKLKSFTQDGKSLPNNLYICSRHFQSKNFLNNEKNIQVLKALTYPSMYLRYLIANVKRIIQLLGKIFINY